MWPARRTVAIMVGNRDFLMGSELARDCGLLALPDPTVLLAFVSVGVLAWMTARFASFRGPGVQSSETPVN